MNAYGIPLTRKCFVLKFPVGLLFMGSQRCRIRGRLVELQLEISLGGIYHILGADPQFLRARVLIFVSSSISEG